MGMSTTNEDEVLHVRGPIQARCGEWVGRLMRWMREEDRRVHSKATSQVKPRRSRVRSKDIGDWLRASIVEALS